jgi:hypothetical protein
VAGRIGSFRSYIDGGSRLAKLTWDRSGFGSKDVDVAQIYYGISASVIYSLESHGFCQRCESVRRRRQRLDRDRHDLIFVGDPY